MAKLNNIWRTAHKTKITQTELFPNIAVIKNEMQEILLSPEEHISFNVIDDLYISLYWLQLFSSSDMLSNEEIAAMLWEVFTYIDDDIIEEMIDIRDPKTEIHKMTHYLYNPVIALWGKAPISLLLHDWGKEDLLNQLGRLKYGILA